MTAKAKTKKKVSIITFLGLEGACAAALILRRRPDAIIQPSSAHRIHRTLQAAYDMKVDEVHVCGVGIKCLISEVLTPLAALHEKGVEVHWYCGYDYLNAYGGDLRQHCQCHFTGQDESIVDAVFSVLFPEGAVDEASEEIRALGTDHGTSSKATRQSDLSDLAEGAIWRYLNYRDFEAYPHAIRVIAGAEELADKDFKTVQSWRTSGERILVGRSRSMEMLRANIGKCGPVDSTVLIEGETGTGKEIVARLIHEASVRVGEAFVALNCATLDGSLLEDMLFGHEKGAFTGAHSMKEGCFESADGGTLFLDEIGEVPTQTQAKLLRAIQEGSFRRLGGKEDIHVDVRIIAATNRDLLEETKRGQFRSDLYYRLAVLKVGIPPLRERKDDIPKLVDDILYRRCGGMGIPQPELTKRQIDILKAHHWPGNVRELENVLERFLVFHPKDISQTLDKDDAFEQIARDIVPLDEFESRYIRSVFERMDRNISKTAEKLNITRNTLKKKLAGI